MKKNVSTFYENIQQFKMFINILKRVKIVLLESFTYL